MSPTVEFGKTNCVEDATVLDQWVCVRQELRTKIPRLWSRLWLDSQHTVLRCLDGSADHQGIPSIEVSSRENSDRTMKYEFNN